MSLKVRIRFVPTLPENQRYIVEYDYMPWWLHNWYKIYPIAGISSDVWEQAGLVAKYREEVDYGRFPTKESAKIFAEAWYHAQIANDCATEAKRIARKAELKTLGKARVVWRFP